MQVMQQNYLQNLTLTEV